jgi:heme oxygenase
MSHKIIKEETKALHSKLDQSKLLKNIMTPTVTVDDYQNFLTFHYCVNKVIASQLKDAYSLLNMTYTDRVSMLKNDIIQLIMNRDLVFVEPDLDLNRGKIVEPCLGAIYVVEGARHGNYFIHQHLVKYLGVKDNESSFLSHSSPVDWEKIKTDLDNLDDKNIHFSIEQAKKLFAFYIEMSNTINDQLNEKYSV